MRKRPYRRRKYKVILILVLMAGILLFSINTLEKKIRPTLESVAESRAKNIATRTIADAVNDVMKSTQTEYGDLVVFQKNADNNITAVTLNIIAINSLKSVVTAAIESKLSSLGDMTVKIPLGTFSGKSLLSGLGPTVKVRIIPVGYTEIDVKNYFSSSGINQTKNEIYLDVKCSISILLPVSAKTASVTTQIPIAETVIVGLVPDSYTNVTDQDGNPKDTVLNLAD